MRVKSEAFMDSFRQEVRRTIMRAAEKGRFWLSNLMQEGWHTVDFPTEMGGMGYGAAVILCEELGRAQCPQNPEQILYRNHWNTAARATGAPIIKELQSGNPIFFAGFDGCFPNAALEARFCDNRYLLKGRSYPFRSDVIPPIIFIRADSSNGSYLFKIANDHPGCRVIELLENRSRDFVAIEFSDVDCGDEHILMRDAELLTLERELLLGMRLRHAAYMLGLSVSAQMTTISYANRRIIASKPLIEYESIGNRLATLVAETEVLRLALAYIAWQADNRQVLNCDVNAILAATIELASESASLCIQWHGAYGLTLHSKIHTSYLRIAEEKFRFGTPAQLWRAVATEKLSKKSLKA